MKVNFKKPKNKKSFRKKQKLDVDALEAEAVSAGLGAADLGSRNGAHRQGVREEKERLESERRDNIYKMMRRRISTCPWREQENRLLEQMTKRRRKHPVVQKQLHSLPPPALAEVRFKMQQMMIGIESPQAVKIIPEKRRLSSQNE
ncbi:SART-1 family protein DOT2-like isoform X2 [Malus domestica]|uniref:SART-1 family protein DOT2-like isoform X2 n=1 Tax=Malus domestica TaxID=3750 RepID=UPI000498EC90